MFSLAVEDGSVRWQTRGFQLASLVTINDRYLLTMNYECEIKLLQPSRSSSNELARFAAFPYQRCLTLPSVVGNMLFVRNERQMTAFRLDGE